MEVIEIQCKSLINRMNDGYFAMRYLPFRLTANIYRGCTHGCVYCYAPFSHYYMKASPNDFSKKVFVKVNAIAVLEKELHKYERSKRKSVLIVGNISDTYQPLEMKYRLTRATLELCLKHRFPCFIETKSPLILSDLDIIEQLAAQNLLGVGMTVTSYDTEFTKLVEPFVPQHRSVRSDIAQKDRVLTLKKLASIGVDTYLHITPYFPLITDRDIDEIISDAADARVGNVIMAPLELSSHIRKRLFEALMTCDKFAFLVSAYEELYLKKGRRLGPRISTSERSHRSLEQKVASLCRHHGIGYWAFTNPQLNTARVSGAYALRYPILIDYWNMAKRKGEIRYRDAVQLANSFPVDGRYLKKLREYWLNGKLFEGVHGIRKLVAGPEPSYIYHEVKASTQDEVRS